MSPEEFIETAERLLVEPCKEADQRSAVSRAYYGALHASRDSVPRPFVPTEAELSRGETHKAVIDSLARWGKAVAPGRTGAQQAARNLAVLKKARKDAEYEIADPVDSHNVASCVVDSRRILKLVRDARALYDKQQSPKQA
ncbi:hypothetical protein [Trinickia dinghuensis]|uniref:hypothetical protein n=1 Tax=Trinickia dinghuensis TaxID=2291023 RepID=UPI0011C05E29|nr:hypothetical protein [Trinickia dinghuensis]